MLKQVLIDLRVFLYFYSIIIFMFSMMFAVIGIDNETLPGKLHEYYLEKSGDPYRNRTELYPSEDYQMVPLLVGFIITLIRLSIGDFMMDGVPFLSMKEQVLYWTVWILAVFISNIIFLNFIIAELSNIYAKITEELTAMQNYGKA